MGWRTAYATGRHLFGRRDSVRALSSKPPFIGVVDWQQVHHKVPPPISKRRADLGIEGAAPIPAEWEETIAACLAKNPKAACTLILIDRNCEAFLLSAACTIPIWDRQSKPAASLLTAAELISAVDDDDGSLELLMLRPRAMG